MKKSILPIVLILLIAGFAFSKKQSSRLEVRQVTYVHFTLEGLLNQEQATEIKKNLKKQKGVTAASVNFESGKASAAFFPEENNRKRIRLMLDAVPGIAVADYELVSDPNRPTCPMKTVGNWFSFLN
ncbi:hypothetical protein QWY31_04955 [Cytophagales bacterium LB-30]|uniref:HMA domain-containing protein n=1 Tax=Shiella aurantiaca TaxID=3058365 RepID=A0ABT8F3G0_9BACT|nr:hypothetical protein [Shiella aurantiaca]MDN4164838.1 hypothetical protein [Shiella aurantiaca]